MSWRFFFGESKIDLDTPFSWLTMYCCSIARPVEEKEAATRSFADDFLSAFSTPEIKPVVDRTFPADQRERRTNISPRMRALERSLSSS